MRATVSVGPPAVNGTISLTGLSGQVEGACASATIGAAASAAMKARRGKRWVTIASCSVGRGAGGLHDLGPARDLAADVGVELLGRVAHRGEADVGHALL